MSGDFDLCDLGTVGSEIAAQGLWQRVFGLHAAWLSVAAVSTEQSGELLSLLGLDQSLVDKGCAVLTDRYEAAGKFLVLRLEADIGGKLLFDLSNSLFRRFDLW